MDKNLLVFQDKKLVQILIYQFVSNGLKYTNAGSLTIVLSASKNSRSIKLSFQDTGIGMGFKARENLNEFLDSKGLLCIKTSNHSTGANLGLTICKKILRTMHPADRERRIFFKSEKGKGSKFTITFATEFKQYYSLESIDKTSRMHTFERLTDNLLCKSDNPSYNESQEQNNNNENKQNADAIELQDKEWENKRCIIEGNTTEDDIHNYLPQSLIPDGKKAMHKKIHYCGCPKSILLADDEEFNLLSFQTFFNILTKNNSNKNIELVTVRNGQEAIDKFKEKEATHKCFMKCSPFTLIILDYNMPIKTGAEAAEEIVNYSKFLSKNQKVPEIYGWTAYVNNDYETKFMNAKAKGMLSKPLSFKEIKKLLQSYDFVENTE